MTDALRVRGLLRTFGAGGGAVPVLRGLDLSVAAGALVALLGPSGCGKTTLLRLVAGFDRPDAGTVHVQGRPVTGPGTHVPPERRRVGVVPQEGAVFPHLSVRRNVGFGLSRTARRSGAVERMLALVGLDDLAERMPHELSGGQLQRVALARALAPSPSVVLLDEPFAALDTSLRTAVREEVRAVLRASGAAALLVTHDQQEALSMADEVAILHEGRVVQQGAPMTVYQRPASAAVADVLGEAVLVPGTAHDAWVRTPVGRLALHARGSGPGRVLVRPEQVRLRVVAEDGAAASPLVTTGAPGAGGRVSEVRFFGHDALVTVAVPGQAGQGTTTVRARVLGAPTHLAPGTAVQVTVSGPVTFFA
jgi:iron(III) transport system ATP-binding protein